MSVFVRMRALGRPGRPALAGAPRRRAVGRAAAAVLALVVVPAALAACGVRSQASPAAIDRESAPADLMQRPTTTTIGDDTSGSVPVFFVATSRLVPASRPIDGEPTAQRRLRALLEGPTTAERRLGLTTAIPRGGDVSATGRDGGTVEVRLDTAFRDGAVPDQATAFAQVVFTLTADSGVRRVAFLVDGEPVAIPRPDGSLTAGAVTRSDFASLAPS